MRRVCPLYPYSATGEHHGARLAGDRLVSGRYETIDVAEVAVGVLEGYSAALNVNWRWEDGWLGGHDPATGLYIASFESERIRADAAEARVRELEAELRRLRDG